MPEIRNDGVRISYDVAGEGRPLVRCTAAAARLVLRSVVVDRAGVRRGAQGGSPLVVVDLRGHGTRQASRGAAYTTNALNGDVFADAEGWIGSRSGAVLRRMDRVDDRGRRPERIPAMVSSDRGTRDPFTKSRRRPTSGMWPSGTVGRERLSTCSRTRTGPRPAQPSSKRVASRRWRPQARP